MKNLNNTTNFNNLEIPMNTLKLLVEATIKKASVLSAAEIISSFPVKCDFVDFINWDKDSLVDLYVSHVCYDLFFHAYPKIAKTL